MSEAMKALQAKVGAVADRRTTKAVVSSAPEKGCFTAHQSD